MKKKRIVIILSIIVILIITFIFTYIYPNFIQSNKDVNSETIVTSNNQNIDNINEEAVKSIKTVKESTTSPYITLFDKYNNIEYISNSIEIVEEGIYKGIVCVSAPNFNNAFNEYLSTHDDNYFEPERYEEILEEILSSAEIITSEHEILFYINENSELIPILNDNVINAMYGDIQDIYFNELFKELQKGNENEN